MANLQSFTLSLVIRVIALPLAYTFHPYLQFNASLWNLLVNVVSIIPLYLSFLLSIVVRLVHTLFIISLLPIFCVQLILPILFQVHILKANNVFSSLFRRAHISAQCNTILHTKHFIIFFLIFFCQFCLHVSTEFIFFFVNVTFATAIFASTFSHFVTLFIIPTRYS